jgi:hypothetical protein
MKFKVSLEGLLDWLEKNNRFTNPQGRGKRDTKGIIIKYYSCYYNNYYD